MCKLHISAADIKQFLSLHLDLLEGVLEHLVKQSSIEYSPECQNLRLFLA